MALAGVYSISIAFLMLGQWTFFLVRRQVPELVAEPIHLLFHLLAELITAITWLLGGWGLVTRLPWGRPVQLVSLGMLLYTLISSCGYFAQKRIWRSVGMLVFLLAFTLGDLCPILPFLPK